jgi:methylene-fatty-acyl-phospholipid synthase
VIVPAVLVAIGQTFVITSTWQLGITGTFLGDYFGILLDEVRVFAIFILHENM